MGDVSTAEYRLRIEQTSIVMADGVALAATLYMPDGHAPGAAFPALLELLPYRKDDGTDAADRPRYEYFAQRAYVGARVDIRGTGASEGIAADQYSPQEGRDALEVIQWLADQPWCNGAVGMWGISYGGCNSIQIAMLHPPALKAIIVADAADDLYTDDIMFWNGALQFEALGRYPLAMIANNMLPGAPDYDVTGRDARDRFDNPHEPWLATWLGEQRDGPYWRRQSLRPAYDALEIPTLMFGGWLDGYPDSIPRMLRHLRAPTKAIIGPWPHAWPQDASPGPRIDGLLEALRWWDYWLKGRETGVLTEPRLAFYVQHYYRPGVATEHIPGEWCVDDAWPDDDIEQVSWYPQADGGLAPDHVGDAKKLSLTYVATVGTSNRYRVQHSPAELVTDQRADDAHSLSFTSAPLKEPLEILGSPHAVLFAEATAPVANWIVRVSDIAPDGSSQLVSKGVINGAHRNSHAVPEPLVPGTVYQLSIELKVTSWVFAPDHRIRVSVCNADFPNLWPSPHAMVTSLHLGAAHETRVVLPVRVGRASSARIQHRIQALREPSTPARRPRNTDSWQIIRDPIRQTTTSSREVRYARSGTDGSADTTSTVHHWACTASDQTPADATLVATFEQNIGHGEHATGVKASLTIESDERNFRLSVRRELTRDGDVVKADIRERTIPRDHV